MPVSIDSIKVAEYAPSLYRPDALIEPIDGFDAFNDAMVEQYRDLGFVSIKNAFSPQEVTDAIAALKAIVGGDLPPEVELQYESGTDVDITSLGVDERMDYIRKFMWFSHLQPALDRMMHHPKLIDIITRILGREPEMFQDMALLKPPGIGREKPWHQDHAYFNLPEGTPVVGVWIALDAATTENGCMHFLPGVTKMGLYRTGTDGIGRSAMPIFWNVRAKSRRLYPVAVFLIFDGLTPHGTPTNKSGERRKAVQYHYVAKGTPRTTTEERIRIFGSEGRNVSC